MKSSTKFFLAFVVMFGVLFLIEYNQEEPIDWSPGFGKSERKPFGAFLLHTLLPDLFKGEKIETVNYSVVEQLGDNDTVTGVNYIFLDENIKWNDYECNTMLYFVSRGNTVFLGSNSFTDSLMHSLFLKSQEHYFDSTYKLTPGPYHFNFCKNLQTMDTGYSIRSDLTLSYFDSLGSGKHWVAGDAGHHCIVTEVDYGHGKFILTSLPYAFTNYSIMRPGNVDFVMRIFQRMPLQTVWWDEHYKSGRNDASPLRVILSKKGLRWAYYISISGLILFVIFMGKRRQRIIPVSDPMKNTSLEFAETVGQVYYEKQDHGDLARKQIKFLFEYIRSRYFVHVGTEWKKNPEQFYEHLSNRSGMEIAKIRELFNFINAVDRIGNLNTAELLKLNRYINEFKSKN